MNKAIFSFLVLAAIATGVLIASYALKAEDTAIQIPISDEGKEAVAVETAKGDVFVIFIIKEDQNKIYVRNLDGTIEGEVERSEIANIRKPTAREIRETQERLGMLPKETSSQETKQ